MVAARARAAGLDAAATAKLVLSVNELAANSLRHGGGQGTIRLWQDRDALLCEVRDGGHITGPALLGRHIPTLTQVGGRGLWLVNQLCDLVQIRSSPAGTAVRLHMRLSRTAS